MCLWIIRYVKAIDIQPPAIGISLRLLCNKAYLGSYPLAFAHGKRCSCLGELLAVTTESEPNNALIYPHSEIYFFVNSKLIIVIVLTAAAWPLSASLQVICCKTNPSPTLFTTKAV